MDRGDANGPCADGPCADHGLVAQNVRSSSSSGNSPHTAATAGPAPFLVKTYEMVDDASTDSVVSWSPAGTSFVVWDPQYFCQHLLPRYFKHSNFSSFIRQLNIYGFRKSDPDRWEFINGSFMRGQRHLLQGIRRRTSATAGGRQQTVMYSSREYQREVRDQQCDAVAQCTTQMQNQLVLAGSVFPMDIQSPGSAHSSEQGMQEEIQRLKREKNALMMEVMCLRQKLQSTEQNLQTLWQRLEATEHRQHHMLAFVTRAANISSQSVLENFMDQQQPHVRGQSQQQIPWQPLNVAPASAKQASDIGNSERRRPQLPSPFIRGISSTSDSTRTGFQAAGGAYSVGLRSPRERAVRASVHPEDYDHGNIANSSRNPGFSGLHSQDAHGHPPQSERDKFSRGGKEEELSYSSTRPQLRFLSHSTRLESPSTSAAGLWLQNNRSQAPKPILVHREGREISDTLLFARPEHSSRRAHEYSYQIITREVSIGASFLPKMHSEAEGSAQDVINVGRHETGSSSIVSPVAAHGYTHGRPRQEAGHDAEEIRALQAIRRRTGDHRSAFSYVGSVQNEQAQFGTLFGASTMGTVVSESCRSEQAGPSSRPLSNEESQQEGTSQGLSRVPSSIMSESELHLPTTIKSGVSDNNAFESDSAFWELLSFSSAHFSLPDQETSCSAAATSCSSTSSQRATQPTNIASAAGSSDHDLPRQEWPWRDEQTSSDLPPPSTSWPGL